MVEKANFILLTSLCDFSLLEVDYVKKIGFFILSSTGCQQPLTEFAGDYVTNKADKICLVTVKKNIKNSSRPM